MPPLLSVVFRICAHTPPRASLVCFNKLGIQNCTSCHGGAGGPSGPTAPSPARPSSPSSSSRRPESDAMGNLRAPGIVRRSARRDRDCSDVCAPVSRLTLEPVSYGYQAASRHEPECKSWRRLDLDLPVDHEKAWARLTRAMASVICGLTCGGFCDGRRFSRERHGIGHRMLLPDEPDPAAV